MEAEDYLALPYAIELVQDADEAGHRGWVAEIEELPGCISQGATAEEGKEVYRSDDAARHWRRTAAVLTDHNVGDIPSGGGVGRGRWGRAG